MVVYGRAMKKLFLGLVLTLLVLPSITTSAAPQSADDIIEKHLAAMGGRQALAKLTSRTAVGTVTVGTQAGDLSGPIETWAKAPNKSRAVLKLDLTPVGMSDTMIVDQRFDGTDGWSLNSIQGDTPMEGDQLNSVRNNMFPSGFLNYKEQGTTVAILPKEMVAGKDLIVLQVTPKTGPVSKVYLDPVTFLAVRSWARVTLPQVGEIEQTSEALDYRVVDGVQVAFRVVNASAIQSVTIQFKTIEHNVPIDDAMFRIK